MSLKDMFTSDVKISVTILEVRIAELERRIAELEAINAKFAQLRKNYKNNLKPNIVA
jgi:hypothetical protein